MKQEAASRAGGPAGAGAAPGAPAAASSAAAADSGAATLRVYRGTPPAWSKPAHAQAAALLVTNSGRQQMAPSTAGPRMSSSAAPGGL